jgi:hypothetical protein
LGGRRRCKARGVWAESLRQKDRAPEGVLESPVPVLGPAPTG